MKRCFVLFLISSLLTLSRGEAGQDPSLEEARQLNQRALELSGAGRYEQALPLAERVLALIEKARGPGHPAVAVAVNNLAELYRLKGDYTRAEPLYLRALAIQEKNPDTGQAALATTLSNLAELYKDQGNYARAEPLQHRALAIRERMFGPEHSSVATTLNNFADLYRSKGDYARAEPLYQRALAIYVKVSGAEHADVALVLNNLAALYQYKGDYARAEPIYLRALAIREKVLGRWHPDVGVTLNNLAECYRATGDIGRAAMALERALTIQVRINPERPDVAIALNNLAGLYYVRGEYARAEPFYLRALAITTKAFGPEHPDVARSINNLAALYAGKGDDARAESGYLRALAIREKVLGPDHPSVAVTLNNLSDLCRSKGDPACAVQFLQRNLEIRERNLNLVIASGSEDQKQLYINTLSGETSYAVWLHVRVAPTDPTAAELALTTILRRKGRALDVMTDQIAILRQRAAPQDRQLLDQLAVARSELATLQLSSSAAITPRTRQAGATRLAAVVAQLEDQVSRRSAEFRALVQPVTLEAVRQSLPPNTALVEIASYKPFNPKATRASERFGPPQYVAYVLKRDAATPQFVDLGEAALIDHDIAKLRAALQDPKRGDVKALARSMDERLMKPVRALLGATRHVFISPDGALNLIPFAALVDEGGRYLVERYTLSYLTTGRDLLRLQLARASRAAPLVMGDPLYNMRQQPAVAPPPQDPAWQANPNRRSINFAGLTYSPLPGTGQEARALQALLPGARLLLQHQATEAALKQARAPRILHIATHGFFLPDQPATENADTRAFSHGQGIERAAEKKEQENPLLRSGIVLAGVNQQQSGAGEDGVLTALEASGLDLWGTQLVVLSACETGLGEVRNGQGVYGLRRALLLAGSETQLISLWSVSDEATRDLMVGFYKRLQAGEGRAEALRNVQLEMLGANAPEQSSGPARITNSPTAPRYSHPYFWAPFIESGAWTTMAAHTR
ncbi:MAG TPA: CHAT domain-containing tetratricopeptide repeat protein [Blastocatellia bacterium]|nr:CHAT domain-containing tetratricopeptide repeat protein [Blastocatellia bacterium]